MNFSSTFYNVRGIINYQKITESFKEFFKEIFLINNLDKSQSIITKTHSFDILAQITSLHSSLARNNIGKISLHNSEIELRLREIPVYTITDKNSAFSLLSGKINEICLFFMNKHDAEKYHNFICEENPKLAKKIQVVKLGLDQYYKCASQANKSKSDTYVKNVFFRLVPDPLEVTNAHQIIKSQRTSISPSDLEIDGVPLYQIRSLSVKFASGTIRATPLFFSKEDAEVSLSCARHQKESVDKSRNQLAIIKAKNDVEKAKTVLESIQIHSPPKTNETSSLASRYERQLMYAEQRLSKANLKKNEDIMTFADNKYEDLIEVGSLEWVIQEMELDRTGSWSEVIFIPPNYFTAKKKS